MNPLAIYAFLLCLGAALFLTLYHARSRQLESQQLQRLRDSALYQELHAKLSELTRYDIDQIQVECSGVTVTSCCPAHTLLTFRFKQNGSRIRNDAHIPLYAELIAQDFPIFTHREAYKIKRYKVYRLNGKPEDAFAFIMRRGYKDYLLANRRPAQLRIF